MLSHLTLQPRPPEKPHPVSLGTPELEGLRETGDGDGGHTGSLVRAGVACGQGAVSPATGRSRKCSLRLLPVAAVSVSQLPGPEGRAGLHWALSSGSRRAGGEGSAEAGVVSEAQGPLSSSRD